MTRHQQLKLRGLIAAPHTPFRHDETLALDVIPAQARLLERNGVRGAFVCGTTGEGSSLTSDERRLVAEHWRAAAPAGLELIVHVGHASLAESRALAHHAQEIGADRIAVIVPNFFQQRSAAQLATWCARIAEAAPAVPFYYYHMPAITGVTVSAEDFLTAAHARIPTLAGVKFTHENLMDFLQSTTFAGGKYEVLFGRDEILLAGLSLGARGAIGSTYNFAAPIFHRIMRAFAAGDIAASRRDQLKVTELITVLNRHGGLSAGKAVMKMIGVDCGPVRLPLVRLSLATERKLKADLKKAGFFDFASRA